MIVRLRSPAREVELEGPLTAAEVVDQLDLNPESVLVLVDRALVPRSSVIADSATVEIRRVISGGLR